MHDVHVLGSVDELYVHLFWKPGIVLQWKGSIGGRGYLLCVHHYTHMRICSGCYLGTPFIIQEGAKVCYACLLRAQGNFGLQMGHIAWWLKVLDRPIFQNDAKLNCNGAVKVFVNHTLDDAALCILAD